MKTVLASILICFLSGCGVSETDYTAAQDRIAELEEEDILETAKEESLANARRQIDAGEYQIAIQNLEELVSLWPDTYNEVEQLRTEALRLTEEAEKAAICSSDASTDFASTSGRWDLISETDEAAVYLDTCSVSKEDNGVFIVWIKSDWNTTQVSFRNERFNRQMSRIEYNCRERTAGLHSVIFLLYDEMVGGSGPVDLVIEPGSTGAGETMLEHICSNY